MCDKLNVRSGGVISEKKEEIRQQFLFIHERITAIIRLEYPDMFFFLHIRLDQLSLNSGNGCALCSVETINDWAAEMNLVHETNKETVN